MQQKLFKRMLKGRRFWRIYPWKQVYLILLILVGLLALTGLDRLIEGAIVQVMPDWLVGFATQL